MLRYEASIRELFYRSCTAGRSFVPAHDMLNFRSARACHPEPVEGSRVEAFAHDASTELSMTALLSMSFHFQNFAKFYHSG